MPNPGAAAIENLTFGSTMSFVQRAEQFGVPVHLVNYVYGTHTWAYWAQDLREYLEPLMATFADPPAPPAAVSYRSIDQTWAQWGWTVAIDRDAALQFSALTDADHHGFTLSGSGTAAVTTPPFYAPGSVATVTIEGGGGPSTTEVTADAAGRLHLTVALSALPAPGPAGRAAVMGVPDVPPPAGTATVAIAGG